MQSLHRQIVPDLPDCCLIFLLNIFVNQPGVGSFSVFQGFRKNDFHHSTQEPRSRLRMASNLLKINRASPYDRYDLTEFFPLLHAKEISIDKQCDSLRAIDMSSTEAPSIEERNKISIIVCRSGCFHVCLCLAVFLQFYDIALRIIDFDFDFVFIRICPIFVFRHLYQELDSQTYLSPSTAFSICDLRSNLLMLLWCVYQLDVFLVLLWMLVYLSYCIQNNS